MPIQTPQWTDFLICPVCCNEYDYVHKPISLACGHTVCKLCLSKLQRKQCPFDQTTVTIGINDLPVNYALLQLVSTNIYNSLEKNQVQVDLQNNFNLPVEDFHHYLKASKYVEQIALYLKPFPSTLNSSCVNVLSRPMQKKLVMLINCQLLEEEGRFRALKATRSLGERTVTELIIQHQNPQQLSTNLWAAVRARGCQFLGPAMQEEVLKLVLLALEDGSALSRKVLVMFVVQRLEPHFPQASKTSIGHVVQLLYRASCFVVSKRDGDSSLMKLKEEFRTYDALRREHDAQIVEIATEAGLRIAPDQWSALLYGDTTHKSHMQSIIDKLQNPQSFPQSVQELVIALQRTGDPGNLCVLRSHLEYLADIDLNSGFGDNIIWSTISTVLEAAFTVVSGLVNFIKTHGCRKMNNDSASNIAVHASKYKISLCRDLVVKGTCPRGISCTFAHSEEELVKYRSKHRKNQRKDTEMMHLKYNNNNSTSNNRMLHENINEESNCQLCKPSDFLPEYNNLAFLQSSDAIHDSSIITSTPLTINNSQKMLSSHYLIAMNHRKQQFISELQQVLLDVQNQYSAENYNGMHSPDLYCSNHHVTDASIIMNNTIPISNLRDIHVQNHFNNLCFSTPVLPDKVNTCVIGDTNLIESQMLPTFNNSVNLLSSHKEPSLMTAIGDWNINYSKLCCNCGISVASGSTTANENVHQLNRCHLPDDVSKSLWLESVKLQDQLKGLKKQITDIKDKTYEESIINDLKALELRLEGELEEEEEKLWPAQEVKNEKLVK